MAQKLKRSKSVSSPGILLIYTGGTIGMVHDLRTGVLKPFNFSQIREEVPEIMQFNYNIDVVSFDPLLDSSDMQPSHWIKLAEIIGSHYDQYDGFVILHGSDTLAYTASALSFLLEGLSKPVVLTGAQLPVGEIRTDARENLITSIEIAASTLDGLPAVPEVCIYFDYFLFRGNRASKFHAAKFEAFHSANYPPLAEAGVHIKFHRRNIRPVAKGKLKVHKAMDERVGVIRLFPGMQRNWLISCMSAKDVKAIILETFGNGNAPAADWFFEELEFAVKKGIIILNVTQCPGGMVEQGRYAASAKLESIGVVGGADLTIEAAVTKMMFLLGSGKKPVEIKKLLGASLRGEMIA
jgi:L-asparaginase